MISVVAEKQARSARRLYRAAQQAPVEVVDAATQALGSLIQHRERTAFLTWMLNAVVEHDIVDIEGLVDTLERPETLAALNQRDPLALARLRGLRARKRLLEAEGGTVSGRELAQAFGITRQAVDKRRLNGKLLGIDLGKRGYAYPVWQVGLPGLETVLAELQDYDPWTQALFMLSENPWLEGETPLAVLRRGALDDVLSAAQLYGEQTAA